MSTAEAKHEVGITLYSATNFLTSISTENLIFEFKVLTVLQMILRKSKPLCNLDLYVGATDRVRAFEVIHFYGAFGISYFRCECVSSLILCYEKQLKRRSILK
jgi:hypothetical protein